MDAFHFVPDRSESRKHWMPKMDFPHFDGVDARIGLDKCEAYFELYQIPTTIRASLHLLGSVAHWYQSYNRFENF
jgi:hypothetical protein